MDYKGKVVYVANAKTGKVDKWRCIGEFSYQASGKITERRCFLAKGKYSCSLPKRCVFDTREAALAALKK